MRFICYSVYLILCVCVYLSPSVFSFPTCAVTSSLACGMCCTSYKASQTYKSSDLHTHRQRQAHTHTTRRHTHTRARTHRGRGATQRRFPQLAMQCPTHSILCFTCPSEHAMSVSFFFQKKKRERNQNGKRKFLCSKDNRYSKETKS